MVNAIPVINIETGEIFGCIKHASNRYGIKYGTLKDALRKKGHFRHFLKLKHPNWAKEQDYSQSRLKK